MKAEIKNPVSKIASVSTKISLYDIFVFQFDFLLELPSPSPSSDLHKQVTEIFMNPEIVNYNSFDLESQESLEL